jgi:hypothetical protein
MYHNQRRGPASIYSDGPGPGFSMAEPLGLPGAGARGRVTRLAQASSQHAASPLATAFAKVDSFASGSAGGAFTKIARAAVAAGMRKRLRDPNGIDQGPSSLCGPAALIRAVAFTDPVGYVTFVIGLYEAGRAQLGNLKIKPGADLLAYDPGTRIEAADWIAIASIRDSENWFFDYQSTDNELAGITLPSHLEGWFKKVGFREVINDTSLIIDQDEANLRRASALYDKDWWVCLFINSNMLDAATMTKGSATPDHWVVLTSAVNIAPGGVSFTIFTWGRGHYAVPQSGTLTVAQLLDNYYGHVAARR